MIAPRRQSGSAIRSSLPLELLLTGIAILGALLVVRFLLLAIAIPSHAWSGQLIFPLSNPLVFPLKLAPGGSITLIGEATLADFTTTVLVLAVTIFLVSRKDGG